MKRLILALMVVSAIAMIAWADEPPAPPVGSGIPGTAGWGYCAVAWTDISGTWGPVFALYPTGGSGGGAWRVYDQVTGVYIGGINYAPIYIDLWVELYMVNSYRYTTYAYHRIGNELTSTLAITIQGLIQSNHAMTVSLVGPSTETMNVLHFRHDALNRVNGAVIYGSDLPITWYGRYGLGSEYGTGVQWGWNAITPTVTPPQLVSMLIPACDHWYEFQGAVLIPYHIDDGHYELTLAGCPGPEL